MLLLSALNKGEGESVAFVLALVLTVKIGRNPEYPGYEAPILRWILIVCNVLHVVAHATGKTLLIAGPNWDVSCPSMLLWLVAEYARTIRTIPPLEGREPASQKVITVQAKPVR